MLTFRVAISAIALSILSTAASAATFTVNSTGDMADAALNGTCDAGGGVCTLRAAIQEANNVAGADTINFAIATGPQTITVATQLPTVTQATRIDARTQPGWSGVPIIELVGPGSGNGFALDAQVVVAGFVIRGFGSGVLAQAGATGSALLNNYIGTNAAGTSAAPNNYGVYNFSGGLTVGGTATASDGNLISGNAYSGIRSFTDGLVVLGNRIGTDAAGNAGIANSTGIFLDSGTGAQIGGTAAGAGNVISGNSGGGIEVWGATGTTIQGNRIGTNAAGTAAISGQQQLYAIAIGNGSTNVTIGGTSASARNVLSGNGQGILAYGGTHTILGNYIGLNAAGTAAIPNSSTGISLSGTTGTAIGGLASGSGNVISGNYLGISVSGATGTTILGNYVGTNAAGTAAIGNTGGGISNNSSTNTVIGSSLAGGRNVISGNGETLNYGISTNTAAVIVSNYIGTDAAGTAALPNGYGIFLAGGASTVGGMLGGERNVISGNVGNGIFVDSDGNDIRSNYIGVSASGGALGNGQNGIVIDGNGNQIGGTGPNEGNAISNNGGAGVMIVAGTGNEILANEFDANGGLAIDLYPAGVNTNDLNDADTGPNALANYPVFSLATDGTVTGTLVTDEPLTEFLLQFYSTATCDASGHGEGTLFDSYTVTTDANGDASFTFAFLAPPAPGVILSATATSSETGNTSEMSECVVVGTVNLLFGKSVTPENAGAGDQITYTISVFNEGPGAATNVVVTDNAPAGTTFVGVTTDQGSCVWNASTATCTIATLAAGASATITINAQLASGLAPGSEVTNTATISATETIVGSTTADASVLITATIPTLSTMGAMFAAALLALAAMIALRH